MTTKLYFCNSYDVVAFIKSLIKQNKLNTGTFTVLYRKSGWGKLLRRFFTIALRRGILRKAFYCANVHFGIEKLAWF